MLKKPSMIRYEPGGFKQNLSDNHLIIIQQLYHAEQKPDQLKSRRAGSKRKLSELVRSNHSSENPTQICSSTRHDWFHFHLLHPTLNLQCHILGVES